MRITVATDFKGVYKKADLMMDKGQYALANQVHADSNIYAPAKSYDLRNQSYVKPDNKQVIWNVPYARRQYYNQFSRYTTPGTGPKWDQKAKGIHIRSWLKITKGAM